jgi:uncharacterized LabA/DUF88 family protein
VKAGRIIVPDDKVAVYIDGSNLYHSLKSHIGRTNLDFGKLAAKLVANRRLVRVYYYNAPLDQTREPTQYREQQRFFQALRHVDYLEIRLGRLVYRGSPPVAFEKGVDIKLATDMLVHGSNDNYDVALLVSGDTDFADALQAVKDQGHHVEVALFEPGGSQRLREVADKVIRIDTPFLIDCWR